MRSIWRGHFLTPPPLLPRMQMLSMNDFQGLQVRRTLYYLWCRVWVINRRFTLNQKSDAAFQEGHWWLKRACYCPNSSVLKPKRDCNGWDGCLPLNVVVGEYNIRDTVGFLTSANGKTACIIDGTAKTSALIQGVMSQSSLVNLAFVCRVFMHQTKLYAANVTLITRGVAKAGKAPSIFGTTKKCFSKQGLRELFLILSSGTFLPCVPHLTVSLYLCSSGSNARGKVRPLEGCRVSSNSPSRVRDGDEGVAGRNGRE